MNEPLQLSINVERFQVCFTPEYRMKHAARIADIVHRAGERINQTFFANMKNFHHQQTELELSLPDLFAPNLCILDFALDHFSANDCILDWGCGLGICAAYLQGAGFDACGFDDWSQLPRWAAEEFQDGLDDEPACLLMDWHGCEPRAVSHVSIWAPPTPVWSRRSVEWILSDSHYVHSFEGGSPTGFYKFGEYPGTLTVFKRIGD